MLRKNTPLKEDYICGLFLCILKNEQQPKLSSTTTSVFQGTIFLASVLLL
jgi:hypothetical protein